MQGLRCHFISMSSKSPTKLKVTSRHDHSCLLGRILASNQTNKSIFTIRYILSQTDNAALFLLAYFCAHAHVPSNTNFMQAGI